MTDLTKQLEQAFTDFRDTHGQIEGRLDELEARLEKSALDTPRGPAVRGSAPFLAKSEPLAPHFIEQAQRRATRDGKPASIPEGLAEIRPGALLAAMAGGQKVAKHLNDYEQKAMLEMTGPAGGYLVGEAIGSLFIDAVRPRTRVLEAGARSYPMEAPIVDLPGWDDKITAGWRGEGGTFTAASPTFRKVRLEAKSVATIVELSIELFEDADKSLPALSAIVEAEIGRALAEAVDLAAINGTGSGNEPLGLLNLDGANDLDLGSGNGAAPVDYDFLLDAFYACEQENFTPTAALYSARTAKTLAKLKTGLTGDKTQLTVPEPIRGLPRLVTNQVPDDLTVGTSTDCSAAIVGDWAQLVIGFRPEMSVRVQADPYSKAEQGIVRIAAYMRADVAWLNRLAFTVVGGVRP